MTKKSHISEEFCCISLNLKIFSIEEKQVTLLIYESGRLIGEKTGDLSEICNLGYRETLREFGIELLPGCIALSDPVEEYEIFVVEKGDRVGHLDIYSRFLYDNASSVKDALGWFIVTGPGRESVVKPFDLNKVSEEIVSFVYGKDKKSLFPSEDFGIFLARALGDYLSPVHLMDVQFLLWNVARRQLGFVHL